MISRWKHVIAFTAIIDTLQSTIHHIPSAVYSIKRGFLLLFSDAMQIIVPFFVLISKFTWLELGLLEWVTDRTI